MPVDGVFREGKFRGSWGPYGVWEAEKDTSRCYPLNLLSEDPDFFLKVINALDTGVSVVFKRLALGFEVDSGTCERYGLESSLPQVYPGVYDDILIRGWIEGSGSVTKRITLNVAPGDTYIVKVTENWFKKTKE